jgi:hypothetical protein
MKLIGNTNSLINWDQIIDECLLSKGNKLIYNYNCFPNTDDFKSLDEIWKNAGYAHNTDSIEWINYFPEKNFQKEIVDTFHTIVNAKPWMVWISRIRPGKMAPWHYDAHQNIKELLNLGNPVRYTCYIQDPQPGHISIVDNSAIYHPIKGSIYQWPSYDAWHCGMNGGLVDKFMFNYWGYQ